MEHPEEETVINIGSTKINRAELRDDIENIIFDMGIPDYEAKNGLNSIINEIVRKKLILEYGREKGITVSENELESAVLKIKQDYNEDVFNEMLLKRYINIDEWKEDLREELLIKKIEDEAIAGLVKVSFDETKEYYDTHLEEFSHPQMYLVMQVVTKTKKEMNNIIELIKNGGDMSELASEYSIAPEAENGGLMGWIAKGDLEEKLDSFIFKQKVGEISRIYESPYGFHLFKVLEEKEEGVTEFPEAINKIEAIISSRKREVVYRKWLEDLKTQFPVNIKENQIYADWNMEG